MLHKYFFASFNNDRGLSLDDKTKDYADRKLLGHTGLQNMKVGEKMNLDDLPLFV